MESSAPALQRGLAVLRHLEREGACSLDQLARGLAIPKASLLRLLETLIADGAVARDAAAKRYRALLRLVPCGDPGDDPGRAVAARLPDLAEATGATAEYHAWDGRRLVLVDRAEPEDAQVAVVARIGFERDLAELDALTQVCRAYGGLRRRRHWVYDAQGARRTLDPEEIRAVDATTRERGWAADLSANTNGVLRHAAPVRDHAERLRGVVALARTGRRRSEDGPAVHQAATGHPPPATRTSEASIA